MNYEEKTISVSKIYKGGIIEVEAQKVTLPDGRTASRDIIRHPGAAAIIPINDKNEVYMVRQFRKPIESVLLEIPAGKLDHGEDPKICAERELKEETGLTAAEIKHLVSVYSTPGFSDEVLHIYSATGLSEGETCADEDEFISCEKIHMEKLIDMVLNNEINDAKSVIGILLADRMYHPRG